MLGNYYNEAIVNPDQIPKRIFPLLERGGESDKIKQYDSLDKTLEVLDNLVGISEVKNKIYQLVSFIKMNNCRYLSHNIENPGLFYNTAILGNRGSGKNTIASILANVLYHLGVVGRGKLFSIDARSLWTGMKLDQCIGNAQSGIVLIDNIQRLPVDKKIHSSIYTTINSWFTYYKDNFVFILAGEAEGGSTIIENDKINKYINFEIHIPDFSEIETIQLMKKYCQQEKYEISKDAEEELVKYIRGLKENHAFDNVYTVKPLLDKAIINNGCMTNFLEAKAFNLESYDNGQMKNELGIDPLDELNSMIGLDEVKNKVKEILAYGNSQLRRKELGLKSEPLCLHMEFTGNPGTGKTTVARLIGKIFKDKGILSTGQFVEVTREDLIAKYVGHTAEKTAEKIRQARGGVLFIDECYSLFSESKIDFGHEAVSTLVKKMEDLRDDLIVIFAGYPKEMEEFINMNPGLRDRIQFKMVFNDYNDADLMQILMKFIKDNEHQVQ